MLATFTQEEELIIEKAANEMSCSAYEIKSMLNACSPINPINLSSFNVGLNLKKKKKGIL